MGEAFDDDPFMLFRLRGRTQEQILEGLRARRAEGDEETGPDLTLLPTEENAPTPLSKDVLTFWGLGASLADFQVQPKSPDVRLGLLQRLGQPSFAAANLKTLLGTAYDHVTTSAEKVAYGEANVKE